MNNKAVDPCHNLAVFPHRLAYPTSPDGGLTDSIGLMAGRALGVLNLLSLQFEDEGGRLSDALLVGAIDSVINEIEDIRALVTAFNEASAKQNQRP